MDVGSVVFDHVSHTENALISREFSEELNQPFGLQIVHVEDSPSDIFDVRVVF